MAIPDQVLVCPVCGDDVEAFLPLRGRENARCPSCGVLERHRFLGYLIGRLSPFIATASAVLDVAPQTGIRFKVGRSVVWLCRRSDDRTHRRPPVFSDRTLVQRF